MGDVVQIHPKPSREEQLAALLHGICLLAPRLRSDVPHTRLAARLMLDNYCHQARKLGVSRPWPTGGDAA